MQLNITYRGQSADFVVGDIELADEDVRRVAVELLRVGGGALREPGLPEDAFALFVVDRIAAGGTERIFLRPKVPFGAGNAAATAQLVTPPRAITMRLHRVPHAPRAARGWHGRGRAPAPGSSSGH